MQSIVDYIHVFGELLMRWRLSLLLTSLLIALGAGNSALSARSMLPGPVRAVLERVVDGDTIRARAMIWLDQEIRIIVRLRNVDTPELKGRCPREIKLAKQARRFTSRILQPGPIILTDIRRGKYGGRVVARIANKDGRDLGEALINAGLARPYSNRRHSWCQIASPGQR